MMAENAPEIDPETVANLQKRITELQAWLARNKSANVVDNKRNLVLLYESYKTKGRFSPGDLVTWRKGLKNRLHPAPGEPAVVIQMLESPVIDPEPNAGSSSFRNEYDIICGVIVENVFCTYYFESSRFMRYRHSLDAASL